MLGFVIVGSEPLLPYVYLITDEYPYVSRCLSGEVSATAAGPGGQGPGGGGPPPGGEG